MVVACKVSGRYVSVSVLRSQVKVPLLCVFLDLKGGFILSFESGCIWYPPNRSLPSLYRSLPTQFLHGHVDTLSGYFDYVISTSLAIMSGEANKRIARTAFTSAEHSAGNVEAHA